MLNKPLNGSSEPVERFGIGGVVVDLHLGRGIGQGIGQSLVDALDAALEIAKIEPEIMGHRHMARPLACLDVGDRGEPILQIVVEAVLGLIGLEIEEAQDQRGCKAEEG